MTSNGPHTPDSAHKPRKPPRKTSSRGTGTRTPGPGTGTRAGTGLVPGAGPLRGGPQDGFVSADDIRIGAVLYDRDHDMPGRARKVIGGRFVEMERPTGFTWRVHFRRLRPATEREVRQLDALARLHRLRLRGMAQA
jgi:hypothetical protein